MTMLFIGSHATRTCSGDSQRGIFISPRYQLMTGIIYPGKRQFKRAIPACHGQKPWARHGQRKLAATVVPFQIAYAVSIHKAQGLEYDSVKIVITDEVEELVTHNIFYTAITRAREKLKIYWTPEVEEKVINRIRPRDISKDVALLKNYITDKQHDAVLDFLL